LGTGAVALVAGIAFVVATLAPMLGVGGDTAIVPQPLHAAAGAGAAYIGPSVADRVATSAPDVLDQPVNGVAFTMRVASLGYTATVYEGTDSATLLRGPGHYAATPWPGHDGNIGIAAHNVFWLVFSRLKAGDRVELQTRRGLFVYEVTGSSIVSPDDRTVLAPTTQRMLTMTTCYPLWAGSLATKRLIFFAREIGGVA
jgi:LPXTG-site transpeptidase (sortase) family protein